MTKLFALPVFFILFRETLESNIVISVLLTFLHQTLRSPDDRIRKRRLVKQVWLGTLLGCLICGLLGAGLIVAFYRLGRDLWSGAEALWEGVFSMVASIVISLMGGTMLRVSRMSDRSCEKLSKSLTVKDGLHGSRSVRVRRWLERYVMFVLPCVTVLREGLEAVIFMAGVSVGQPASAFPLPVLTGLGGGCLIGWLLYKSGNAASPKIFLIAATCFLYLVAAGLFSKSFGLFGSHVWNEAIGGDAAETGNGPGSYEIRQSVWHVNCCSPTLGGGGGWGVFSSLFGWTNSATYGTVISYNFYWLVVIIVFTIMRFQEIGAASEIMPEDSNNATTSIDREVSLDRGFEEKTKTRIVTRCESKLR